MVCHKCRGADIESVPYKDVHKVAGRTFTVEINALSCTACGEIVIPGDSLKASDMVVAEDIAMNGPVCGETFRFLRKALNMTAAELAILLEVAPETISRWEKDARNIDHAAWINLGSLVLDTAAGNTATAARMQALVEGRKPRKHVLLAT